MRMDTFGRHAARRIRILADPPSRVVTLHPSLAARYARLVAAAAPAIERMLDDRVTANRLASIAPGGSSFALRPWRVERRRHLDHVRALGASAPALLVTDVRRCYPSIRPDVVERMLVTAAVEPSLAGSVAALLRRFELLGPAEGLPIGPEPSAVLANAVLRAADDRLRATGLGFVRWVDDVVVALPRPTDAGRVIRIVDEALATVGLERHIGKTRVIAPEAVSELAVSPSVRPASAPRGEAAMRLG